MPGLHNDKTQLLGFWASAELVKKIEAARGRLQRSQFLRIAAVEKLQRAGVEIPMALADAPDRIGKGGRPRKIVSYRLDERRKRLNSRKLSADQENAKRASDSARTDPGE